MAVQLIVIGHPRRDPLIDAADEYLGKARRQLNVQLHQLDPRKRARNADDNKIRSLEGEAILSRVGNAQLVALDASGRSMDSPAFAAQLQRWINKGDLALVIGGATGLSPEVLQRADSILSFGPMTLPHRLARLLLSEQLYRATAIWSGAPYHK